MSDKTLSVGLIGLDTSHVIAFTKLLNDPSDPNHLPGAKVTVAFPGGSPDFDLSANRVEGFTNDLRDKHGIKMLQSPEAVAEAADLVFIESVDGRAHLDLFKKTAPSGKPTFIDKPFATTVADARAMLDLAAKNKVALMSCSALRYAQSTIAAMSDAGEIVGCDTYGPMAEIPSQPGLLWYGIHQIEMIQRIMGPGCVSARAYRNDGCDLCTFEWADGRLATFRGLRGTKTGFGLSVHRKEGSKMYDITKDAKPFYAGLLEAVLRSLPNGKTETSPADIMGVMQMIAAANESRQSGKPAKVAE
jgi:predicted dehydrogenase